MFTIEGEPTLVRANKKLHLSTKFEIGLSLLAYDDIERERWAYALCDLCMTLNNPLQ